MIVLSILEPNEQHAGGTQWHVMEVLYNLQAWTALVAADPPLPMKGRNSSPGQRLHGDSQPVGLLAQVRINSCNHGEQCSKVEDATYAAALYVTLMWRVFLGLPYHLGFHLMYQRVPGRLHVIMTHAEQVESGRSCKSQHVTSRMQSRVCHRIGFHLWERGQHLLAKPCVM